MSYLSRIAEAAAALELSRDELAYYARHLLLPGIGASGQRKLKAARVLVVGAGGLGCPVLQALAGAGVGRLTVVDGDCVALTNLSRQWLHRYADVGANKALSAERALRALNPLIEVRAERCLLTQDNAGALVEAHDVVVDATDDLGARYCIDDVCADLDTPWVHAALYREGGRLTVFWARCCARFRGLYPEPSEAPSCAGAGILGATASVVGHLQAQECIKLITGHGQPALGRLVAFDASGPALEAFQMPGVCLPPLVEGSMKPDSGAGISGEALSQALSIHEPLQLLDIRSEAHFQAGTIEGARHSAAETILEVGLPEPDGRRTVLFCQEGSLSQLLAAALQRRTEGEVQHLEGGFEAWTQ